VKAQRPWQCARPKTPASFTSAVAGTDTLKSRGTLVDPPLVPALVTAPQANRSKTRSPGRVLGQALDSCISSFEVHHPKHPTLRSRLARLPAVQRVLLEKRRSRRLFATTDTDENAIAAPASIGFSSPAAANGNAARL
jgi:hypothetical protein